VDPGVLRILFIGDIVGRPGRDLMRKGLNRLIDSVGADLVVANVENAAGGYGVTQDIGDTLLGYGVDVMTTGNHVWDRRETLAYIAREPRLLRPANYPVGTPGNGSYLARTAEGKAVGVVNVMGRVFMASLDDPFVVVMREVEALRKRTRVVVVDLHAEATSEKLALGWHLDGTVTAVIGTHTHVQTADEQILPGGTAYLTDVGMTGPHDSIIGMDKAAVLEKFRTGLPVRLETASGNPRVNGVVITADEATGRALSIERLSLSADQLEQGDIETQPAALPSAVANARGGESGGVPVSGEPRGESPVRGPRHARVRVGDASRGHNSNND
jgi:metallophosphoesterase (TIGR00282 family)